MLHDDFAAAIQLENDDCARLQVKEVQAVKVANVLNIDVANVAGELVGKFAVEASTTVKQLKVDQLKSHCNADVRDLTLIHEGLILEDISQWIEIVKAAAGMVVTLAIGSKDPLQDKTIKEAVADFVHGGKKKKGVECRHGHMSNWDTSQVTTMENLFASMTRFNEDLSAWDVSNVTDMGKRFFNAKSFNGDLSAWNVGNVRAINGMFSGARSFNSDLSAWNVGRVTNMSVMFSSAESFNSDLSAWNVSAVTNLGILFYNAYLFNADLNAWNVANVTSMDNMFYNAQRFNGDLNAWRPACFPRGVTLQQLTAALNCAF